jgi:hypothetical protein
VWLVSLVSVVSLVFRSVGASGVLGRHIVVVCAVVVLRLQCGVVCNLDAGLVIGLLLSPLYMPRCVSKCWNCGEDCT